MKKKTFEAVIQDDNSIEIPMDALKDMELNAGDSMEFSYPCSTEAVERCIRVESTYHEEESDGGLFIPETLLEECGMKDKKVHVLCFDGEITITATDKLCEFIPSAILQVLNRYQIPLEEVARAIAESCNGKD